MFSFESNNGVLGRYFNGSREIIKEIVLRYNLKRSQNISDCKPIGRMVCQILGPKSTIELTQVEIEAINAKEIFIRDSKAFAIYQRLQMGNDTYTSFRYKRAKQTIEYFAAFDDGTVEIILFYFFHKNMQYAVVNVFLEKRKVNHFREINKTNTIKVFSVESIKKKYIYIKVDTKRFVVSPPNQFEKD